DDSVGRTERVAPADQAVERREGSGDDDVVSLMMVFGAGSDHLDVGADAQLLDGLGQEGAPSKQGLYQCEQQGRRYAGQASATAHVGGRQVSVNELVQGRAIEDVPIPQAVGFAWAEQAP